MTTVFTIFWTVIVFASIAWYAILLFYVGAKGARELWQMTRVLRAKHETRQQD